MININKTKILVFFFNLILLTSGAYAAVSGAGDPGKNNPPCRSHRHHCNLNLSAEQQSKLKTLKDKFWKETIFLRNGIHVKRLELRTLWAVPTPEKDKIIAKQKELRDLFNQLQSKVTDYRLEARSYLTPEQSAQAGIVCPSMGFGDHMQRHMHKPMHRHMVGSQGKGGSPKNNE
jgi:Spy/CpxP family protein refolding chaperone